jgi:hypothetical protein
VISQFRTSRQSRGPLRVVLMTPTAPKTAVQRAGLNKNLRTVFLQGLDVHGSALERATR